MNSSRLIYLFERYYSKACTPEERAELMLLVQQDGLGDQARQFIGHKLHTTDGGLVMPEEAASEIQQAILQVKNVPEWKEGTIVHRTHLLKRTWFRAAAILLLIGGTVTYLYLQHPRPPQKMAQAISTGDPEILPGGNRAILTLSDGSVVVLDSAANGALAQQGNTKIIKMADGHLRYELPKQGHQGKQEPVYNTISTPVGGQYQIVLPDGSKVWLNAASSVRFPTVFNEQERRVTITGEAYFEITPGKSRPFIVQVNEKTSVEVLGTSFNINAYKDEDVFKTTLLDGAIKVNRKNESVILRPGQQARIGADEESTAGISTIVADVDRVMAWKRGFFNFEDAGIEEVMRSLARWYNLEVVYETKAPHIIFGGELSRDLNLSSILKALKDSKVHFKIAGRKLIVQS